MPVLTVTNLVLAYGERRILDGVSLSLEPGERVGVVGRNGGGKSTLIRAIAGQLKPDSGTVVLASGASMGYLAQDPALDGSVTLREEAATALAHLETLERELHGVFDEMAHAEGDRLDKLLRRQEALERRIEAAGGLVQDHRVDIVLHGLGFTDAQFSIPVRGLSGGQRARLALAKLLLGEPDLILLDEPTNHLDIAGRLWLEKFLTEEFGGAVLMISHDRYLLDAVVERIIEVDPVPNVGGRLIEYPGNYAAFRRLRAERREAQYRAWERQQTEFKREEAFIRKYKSGQRAKQARGRESRLDRAKAETTLERPLEMGALRLNLPEAPRSGDIVASVRGLSKAYGNGDDRRVLFDGFSVVIERGQRWGIIGPNGAGKTTLVRCMLGELEADGGSVQPGARLAVGYFKQSHDGLDPDKTVIQYLQNVVAKSVEGQRLSEQQARDLAGAFLFSGGDQSKELGLLSGGERSRAVLAGLLATAKNVLVLDEPTNHLDIQSSERLEAALRRPPSADELALDENAGRDAGVFDGTLLLISHDRALLDACCDRLIVLDGKGGAEVFLGTYSEWHRKKQSGEPPRGKPAAKSGPARAEPSAPPPPPSVKAGPREKSKWSWMRLEQIEERISAVSEEMAGLDQRLGDPDVWRDIEEANRLTDRRDALRAELDGLEAEWLNKAE